MSIIEILMYFFLAIILPSALAFNYYSIKLARIMRGALRRLIIACGATLSVVSLVVGVANCFFFYGRGVFYCAFFIGIVGLFAFLIGGYLSVKAIQKVYPRPLLKLAFIFPGGPLSFIGYLTFLFAGVPLSFLAVWQMAKLFSWHSVIYFPVWAFGFVTLALGAKKVHSTLKPSGEIVTVGPEKALLRDDILAVKIYGALTNTFMASVKSRLPYKILKDILTECFEHTPILFEGCKLKETREVDLEPAIKNLDRIPKENSVQFICSAFSKLNIKIMDLYGATTSRELAKKVLGETYLSIKKQFGDLPIVFEILRSLPEGVAEKERLALLSRDELEARVKEATAAEKARAEDAKKLAKELKRATKSLKSAIQVEIYTPSLPSQKVLRPKYPKTLQKHLFLNQLFL